MRDPMEPMRKWLKAGNSLRELARQTGVPVMTLSDWVRRGAPKSVRQWAVVMAWVASAGKRR